VFTQYTDCSSSKSQTGFSATRQNQNFACFPAPCACATYQGTQTCGSTQCNVTVDNLPGDPSDSIIVKSYNKDGCNNADLQFSTALLSGTCLTIPAYGSTPASSKKQSCGSEIKLEEWNAGGCQGTPTSSTRVPFSGSVCSGFSGQSIYYACTVPACIHVDSELVYNGNKHSFTDLPEDCVVPHTVTRDGVKVTTSCPGSLRVTHEHLVMTPEGWKEAGSLKVGDALYSKIGGEAKCIIQQIETEYKQQYSGLNCLESEVEANGHWISTFGNIHAVPAFWMKYGSKVLGVKLASSIGDSFANFFYGYY